MTNGTGGETELSHDKTGAPTKNLTHVKLRNRHNHKPVLGNSDLRTGCTTNCQTLVRVTASGQNRNGLNLIEIKFV
jgi:uncharacterized protein YjbI with pentapeptide repeats